MATALKVVQGILFDFFKASKKDNLEIITKAAIFIGLGFLETILVDEVFRCPCTSDSTNTFIGINWNLFYSLSFFIVPALSLSMLYLVQDRGVWHVLMGCCKSKKTSCGIVCGSCFCCINLETPSKKAKAKNFRKAMFEAFVIAIVWVTLALFDGQYAACALTEKPYKDTCEVVRTKNTNELPFSDVYNRTKEASQLIGICMVLIIVFFYLVAVCCKRCCRDIDYATHVIVDNYIGLKEVKIANEIKRVLEVELNKQMQTIEEKIRNGNYLKDIKTEGEKVLINYGIIVDEIIKPT